MLKKRLVDLSRKGTCVAMNDCGSSNNSAVLKEKTVVLRVTTGQSRLLSSFDLKHHLGVLLFVQKG